MKIIRGSYLTYTNNPFTCEDIHSTYDYQEDGLIFIEDGIISDIGPYEKLKDKVLNHDIEHYVDKIIMPGFIDTHVHYPQTQIIGAYGKELLDWLNNYTFIAEQEFVNKEHADKVSELFLKELIKNGTTTASVYCTVHPQSVEAFFEASEKLNMRNIAGKVMMNRFAPDALLDTTQSSYDDSKKLIEKWHNKGRQLYSITPRFAPTSTPDQLEVAGSLWNEYDDVYLQTHISENQGEIAWVKELYPKNKNYTDVYESFGLLGPRSIYGHGIWLDEYEKSRFKETGSAISHCPTSNLFLGSGLFDLNKFISNGIRTGIATDLGAGTSFSILQTLNETYKVAMMNKFSLSSIHAFYMATLGSAKSLYLEDKVGTLDIGTEADLVVLNFNSTDIMKFRISHAKSLEEKLFVLMTLGDERSIDKTYISGVSQS